MLNISLSVQFKSRLDKMRLIAAIVARAVSFGILFASMGSYQALAADATPQIANTNGTLSAHEDIMPLSTAKPELAKTSRLSKVMFNVESASMDTQQAANWVVGSGDNQNMPFMIIDKKDAKVFVFNAEGKLRGAAPALLGLAQGDDSIPGIGSRKLSSIRPEERTTPAGRFVASLGRNLHKQEILWIDYDAAISLHRVITTNIKERRAQRLASPTPQDRRISYGCINVPVKFYEKVVSPVFKRTNGIVYVLPEIRSMREVFTSYYGDKQL